MAVVIFVIQVIFENCRNSIFLMKNYSKSDIGVCTLSEKSRTDCRKFLSWSKKDLNPSLNIICTVYRVKYKAPCHFIYLLL